MLVASAIRHRLRRKTPPPMQVTPEPRRRLRSKTPPPTPSQGALPQPVDVGAEAPDESKRRVYLITLPHPTQSHASTGERLVAPSSFSKQQILEKVLDAFDNPVRTNTWSGAGGFALVRLGVWREWHGANAAGVKFQHDHVPVLAVVSFRFLPVKKALLQRHGLASHWSCSHDGYFSCVRYCALPSPPKKPAGSLDQKPALWDATGSHPHPILDCSYEQVTSKALDVRRAKVVTEATAKGKAEPRVTDLDVWALVVRAGVRNTDDNRNAWMQLVAYAKLHCGEAMVHYLWKKRGILPAMIDDIWQWECIEDAAASAMRSRVETMKAALSSPCVCNGAWMAFVMSNFNRNGINAPELCHDVLEALKNGRSETTPVICLAGRQGGEGKSVFLKPLNELFKGFVFNITQDSGNFPLLDIMNAKVSFLDEFRFDPDVLSWASMCLLFDGSPVPVGTPKNTPGAMGNLLYRGTAPVFITTKMADLERLRYFAAINPATGAPWDTEASMIWRRLKVHWFTTKVSKPPQTLKYCPRCFCQLVHNCASAWGGQW